MSQRAVLCVNNPWDYIPGLKDYSLMIVNPDSALSRKQYLLEHADWSLLIDQHGVHHRNGGFYHNERLFWYTSGTTGDSKFCSFTQIQLDNLCQRIINSYNITSRDRYVSIMPLWHAHGQGFYWATQSAGCSINFSSIKQIRDLEKYNPTFVTAIPDVLKLIAHQHLPSLRFIRSASSALPENLYHQLSNQFNVPVVEAFGMTEALSHCFTNPLNGIQKPGTVGLPDGVDVRLDNGRLLIQGPTVAASGWYDTGDLAEVDSDGYYRIIGRSRDQINVRGIKINPTSLENQLLNSNVGVDQCVIFGRDSVNCLYVGPAAQSTVIDFLSSLGNYCRPCLVNSVSAIPISPAGKISRAWLTDIYSNG